MSRNYEEKLLQKIMSENYHRKLWVKIIRKNYHLVDQWRRKVEIYRDTGVYKNTKLVLEGETRDDYTIEQNHWMLIKC